MKNYSKKFICDRRNFLSMSAKAGLNASFLRYSSIGAGFMANRFAQAQEGFKQRVLFVYFSNGARNGAWLPTGSNLKDGTKGYESVKQYCNFREVNMNKGGAHGNEIFSLSKIAYGPKLDATSMDIQIGNTVGGGSKFKTVHLGVATDGVPISRNLGSNVFTDDNPQQAFNTLFKGGANPDNGGGQDIRQSILDANMEELKALRNKLGSFEKTRLEQHEESLANIEKRIAAPAGGMNGGSASCGAMPNGSTMDFSDKLDLQADIALMALKCGITKVATLQLDNSQGGWTTKEVKAEHDYHQSFHNDRDKTDDVRYTNFLSGKIARIIQQLIDEPDPVNGGKMIDNTVVVQVTEMGDGDGHLGGNAPHMLATGFKGFNQGTAKRGGSNEDFLAAVPMGLGLSQYYGQSISKLGNGVGLPR